MPIKPDTMDSILSSFTKTANRLSAFADKMHAKIARLESDISQKNDERTAAFDDMNKANAVLGKITKLIEG